jgi:hypothetical protein
LSQTSSFACRALIPAAAVIAGASFAAAQPTTPPMLQDLDRIGIVFTDLDPDVGAGRPTISASVEWVEGPFFTPVLAGPGGETTYESHLTIAVRSAGFYRWDGPPHLLPEFLPADVNRDGVVNHHDVLEVLHAWGDSDADIQLPPF